MFLLLRFCLLIGAVADDATRLTVVNGCKSPIWIAHIASGQVGPDEQDIKISPGQQARFHTSAGGGGLPATRFWPKMGCDSSGSNCTIGDSGGPSEKCVIRAPGKPDDYSHCAPPVDTKFEATFAAPGSSANDVLDMSLVDGYTLPFKLEVSGGSCIRAQKTFTGLDCSNLSLRDCPKTETMDGKSFSLRAINPKSGMTSGCFSPCMRLTDDKWNSNPVAPDSSTAGPYCCAGAWGTPESCNGDGSILKTKYVEQVRQFCSGAYGYAYDDKIATIACSTSTQYKVTFYCPITEPAIVKVVV